jgi:hypothetical protein
MVDEGSRTEGSVCDVCGAQVGPEVSFCSSCGAPQRPGAQVQRDPTVPPPGEGRVETERLNVPPPGSEYQRSGPGVWSGVKIFFGGCIVLPILVIVVVWVIIFLLAALGGSR